MHHAVCIDDKNLGHYLVFVDADIRFIKPLNDSILDELTKGRPITFVKGKRDTVESGFMIIDNASKKPEKFWKWFMVCMYLVDSGNLKDGMIYSL